jgi:hypothetical protein
LELVHHQPLTDEDDTPHQDFNNPCFTGIQNISEWRNKHQNTNVYRSLKIWSDNLKSEALLGPFVIDIDNDCGKLDDTLIVARNAVKCLVNSYNLQESDIRLFFTGHKGFNIEVLPSAFGLAGTPSEQDNKADCIRKKIISELRRNAGLASQQGQARNLVSEEGTIIDGIHDYVRLHDSINKWIENGGYKARRKIGLTLSELNSLSLKQIVAKSIV